MPTAPFTSTPTPEALRNALVDSLRDRGFIRTPRVEAVFRRVARHRAAPDTDLNMAYADDVIRTKLTADGTCLSSISAPWLQAWMLEQASLLPGMRALEIGSGGYNAALMAEVVGGHGHITTVDIDTDVTDRATSFIAESGYANVTVAQADGTHGAPAGAPTGGFDAILVTVQASDIPRAWIDQLKEGGRLVVPLMIRGFSRGVTFTKHNGMLISRDHRMCGFVAMQGAGAPRTVSIGVRDDITLTFDDAHTPPAIGDLAAALTGPRNEVATGVTIRGNESFEMLQLWLASTVADFCHIHVDEDCATRPEGLPRHGNSATTSSDSLAYLTHRKTRDKDGHRDSLYEFYSYGYGPEAQKIADRLAEHVRTWDTRRRFGSQMQITWCPGHAGSRSLPDTHVINKPSGLITLLFPSSPC